MPHSDSLLLETRNLRKAYATGKVYYEALKGIDLGLTQGELICLMGPSGSGKSTLLNLLGLLDVPSSGEIILGGRKLSEFSATELALLRRQFIGFIFQSYNLFPALNAFENIEYPLLFLPISQEEREEKVWQALGEVHLREVAMHKPDELSGGQQQRVAIARALVTEPRLILADEPTAHLDSDSTLAVTALLQQINKNRGTTIVISTHDSRLLNFATRVITIHDGVLHDGNNQATVTNLLEKRLSK